MQTETVKIKAPTSSDNELGFIVINKSDFDSAKHEPFDEDDYAALAGSVQSGERVPTMAELLAARDQLAQRERELNEEKERVADQALANEAEAQRLRDEAAAQAAAAAKKPGIADMRDALTAKGIAFDASASKADLQALLDAAA